MMSQCFQCIQHFEFLDKSSVSSSHYIIAEPSRSTFSFRNSNCVTYFTMLVNYVDIVIYHDYHHCHGVQCRIKYIVLR